MATPESITVTEDERSLPVEKLLTGRGFITGKSGSGKSNTASVIVESLLEAGHPLFVVDTEGEYYGLKEDYGLLHAGADESCDVEVDETDAALLATVVFEHEYPVVLDVSGYFDVEDAKSLIEETLAELFRREKEYRKPTLLVVEEIQEYLPQQGGSDDLAKLLLRIAKRGRKRGLGMCGLSQRPSAVDKDFITQCDWMIWHRLTWETDVDLVKRILGGDIAGEITDLDTGEAFLMTDWDEDVDQVMFQRKQTFDAGATPTIGEEYEEPSFQPVDSDVVAEFDPGKRHADVDASRFGGLGFTSTDDAEEEAEADIDDDAEEEAEADIDDDADDDGNEEAEADGDDDADIQAALERERERNEALQAEVEELRLLLDDRAELPTAPEEGEEAVERAKPAERTERDETWAMPEDPTTGRRSPPLEAQRQSEDGPTGVLVELGQMIAHLFRWLSGTVYRLSRRFATRASDVGARGAGGQQSSLPDGTPSGRNIGGSASLGVQLAVVVGLFVTVGLATLVILVLAGVIPV